MKKPLYLVALLCGMMAMPAWARWNEPGYHFGGHTVLTPSISVGAYWESNVHESSHKKESGAGWRVQPTLSLTHATKYTKYALNGFYTMERGFDSEDALDSDSYGASFNISRELSKFYTLTLTTSYSRSEDDQFYQWGADGNPNIDKDKSENYNVNGALGYQNSRWQWSVGMGWSRSKYLDEPRHTTDSYNLSALVGRAIGPRTYWNVSLSTSWDDADSATSTNEGYYLMTGVSGAVSNKLTYNTLVGVGMYNFDGEHGSETDFGPSYNASVAYKMNRTFAFSLALSGRYEPEYSGYASNYYIWGNHLTGAVNAQWSDKLSSRLNVTYTFEDYVEGKGVHDSHPHGDRTYMQIAFNTYYKFCPNFSVYGGISWRNDDTSGSSGNDDNFRVDLGLTYTF